MGHRQESNPTLKWSCQWRACFSFRHQGRLSFLRLLQKLRDINHMLKQGGGETSRKRALLQDDQSSHPPAKRTASEEVLQRKLTSMLEERQASASR